jgi:uncharacterized membrane protein YphA (DoxX/SURF4 family)
MRVLQSFIAFLGRVCISVIFIVAGVRILMDWQGSEHYLIAGLCDWLSIAMGHEQWQNIIEIAMNRVFVLLCAGVFCALGGGLLVLLGISVRLGAFLLLLFAIPATLLFHHFWTLQGVDRKMQMEMFIQSISIIGALLLLLAYGCGCSKKPKAKEKKSEEK